MLSDERTTITLYENFSESERKYFVKSLLIPRKDTKFVVTERFREVINRINECDDEIAISGPKGVGKSMALAAIATLCHEKNRKCFLWSSCNTGINYSFLDYFRAISEYKDGEFENIYECIKEAVKFLESTDKPLVLIELGSLASYDTSQELSLREFMGENSFQTVISLSSGEGLFSGSKGAFSRLIRQIRHFTSTEFIPFTETEFQIYKGLEDYNLTLDNKLYKELTSYNPSLLSHLKGIKNERVAAARIKSEVNRLINEIFQSADMRKVNNSLRLSVEMLVNAFSNTVLQDVDDWDRYTSSWVHDEHITYVKECDKKAGTFVLSLNFPTTFLNLMVALNKALIGSKIPIKDNLLDGLIFEAKVCEELQWSKLAVLYSSKDEKVACQDDLRTITFSFKSFTRKSPGSSVSSLVEGVLTQLRPKHPVIDAVAYVMVEEEPWLLLIQVSLSSYKAHDSKLTNLRGSNEKDCECKDKESSWIDYYRELIKQEGVKCMYIYISPKEIHEKSTNTFFHGYNLRLKGQPATSVFYGVVLKDSESATMVNRLECEVRSMAY